MPYLAKNVSLHCAQSMNKHCAWPLKNLQSLLSYQPHCKLWKLYNIGRPEKFNGKNLVYLIFFLQPPKITSFVQVHT